MKVIKVSCAILLTALLLSGCGGGDSTGPTAVFEIGSSSLLVTANIDGLDQGGGIFTTNYIVSVLDSLGTPVNDAIITISRSQLGTITLALDIAFHLRYFGNCFIQCESHFYRVLYRSKGLIFQAFCPTPSQNCKVLKTRLIIVGEFIPPFAPPTPVENCSPSLHPFLGP